MWVTKVPLVALCLLCTTAAIPSERVLSNVHSQSYTSTNLCVLDALRVRVECDGLATAQLQVFRLWAEASREDEQAVLYSNATIRCSEQKNVGIECAVNKDHCRPRISAVTFNHTTSTVSVHFDGPTTTPKLMTRAQVLAVLVIAPQPTQPLVGDWIGEDRLDISIDAADATNLLSAAERNELRVTIRSSSSSSESLDENTSQHAAYKPLQLRFKEHGTYTVALVHSDQYLDRFNVKVEFCEETSVIRSDGNEAKGQHLRNHADLSVPGKPEFLQTGVLAVPPKQGLEFHSPSFFQNERGWTLAFWLYLEEPQMPPPEFRTLFYKGVGNQRTPSAWLLPNSRNVALRASTMHDPDVGATSELELPVREWVHLTFVFDNSSQEFAYAFYLNGRYTRCNTGTWLLRTDIFSVINENRMDIALHYQHPVIPNNGSLQLLKDPTHSGPPSLITGLQLWETPLTGAIVEAEYLKSGIASVVWMDVGLKISHQLASQVTIR